MRHATPLLSRLSLCSRSKEANNEPHTDAAFIYRGFRNWKDGTISMSRHESSDYHKEAVQSILVRPQMRDVGEQLSAAQ